MPKFPNKTRQAQLKSFNELRIAIAIGVVFSYVTGPDGIRYTNSPEKRRTVLGTIVNSLAIIAGGLIGLLLKGGIPEKYSRIMMQAIGLAVILIGIKTALNTDDILLVIVSMAVGSALGELVRIEERLEDLGNWLGSFFSEEGGSIAKGFVMTSLLYCVGAMAIVGALESGLTGNHQTLFAKSLLDFIGSIFFASTLGIGVLFAAVPVFIYQGFITLAASALKPFLIPAVVDQMSAVGGLLILSIGLNLLDIKKLKIGNMLPAIFLPLLYHVILTLLGCV